MDSTRSSDLSLCPLSHSDSCAGDFPSPNRWDALAITLLLGSLVALFWELIFTSAMPFYRDAFSYSYPHARFIQQLCRQGQLPYWNPYLYYGQAVLANPQFLFFYPYTLFIILLPIDFAYKMHFVVHFAVAAVGVYWLARRWGQSRVAAFFCAFIFVFSGPVLSLGTFYNHIACAAWIPWALLLTDRAVESDSRRPWILLTLVFSLQFLAGEPFTLLVTFGLCLALAFHRFGALGHPLARPARAIWGRFFLIGILMMALSAVQLLPSTYLLQGSRRGRGLTYTQVSNWSLHPLSLLEIALPEFFGPTLEQGSVWKDVINWRLDPYFPSVFVGCVPLFFAFAGWALGRDRRRGFISGAALTILLLSFGRMGVLFALAYLLVPPLAWVRYPVKLLVVVVLLAALLAGWGFDALREVGRDRANRRRRILIPLSCFLVGTTLVCVVAWIFPGWISYSSGWILQRTAEITMGPPGTSLSPGDIPEGTRYLGRMLRWLLPGLVGYGLGGLSLFLGLEEKKVWAPAALALFALLGLAQLVQVNFRANQTVRKNFYTYRPPLLDDLANSTQPFRYFSRWRPPSGRRGETEAQAFVNFDSIPAAAGLSPAAQSAFRERLLLLRGSMLTGVEIAQGVDIDGSAPVFYHEFWIFELMQLKDATRADCLLGRTNVKHELAARNQQSPVLREVAAVFNGSSEPSILFENLCTVPRAYVANRAWSSTSTCETLMRMSDPDFPAGQEIILASPSPPVPLAKDPANTGRVEIAEYSPNVVRLTAELSEPGYVVLLDRFDPSWHATLDGREVPILRANQLFRAVRATPGKHAIRFYYRQRGLKEGAILSLATLVFLAVLYVVDPSRRHAV